MPIQMLFEEFLDRPSEAAIGALGRVPQQKRDEMIGLLAELMNRVVVPERCQAPADDQPQRLLMGREGVDHE